jgi:hypothetical protein
MTYYSNGLAETRTNNPMPPYNSALNPNYSTFSTQPQFPLNQGSNAEQIQSNIGALSYFNGLNQQVSNIVDSNRNKGTKLPYPAFKSQSERLLYLQGQTIAAAKANASGMLGVSTIYNYINK